MIDCNPYALLSPFLPPIFHPYIPSSLPQIIIGTGSTKQELTNLLLTALFVHYLFVPLISRLLVRPLILRSSLVTNNRMKDVKEVMEANDIFTALMIVGFDLYVVRNRPKSSTPTLTEWIQDNNSGTFDGYLSDPRRRKLFKEYACEDLAVELTTHLQHSVAGLLGLMAFLSLDDEETFLDLIRCGLLWEAGWELGNLLLDLLPSFVKCKITFSSVFTLLHHVSLILYLPILHALKTSIADDIALSVFFLAGFVGPIGLLNFVKNNCYDLDSDSDVKGYFTLQLIQCFVYVTVRGPVWWFLAYRMVTETYGGPNFSVTCVGVAMMTFVNLVIIDFCRIGLIKALTRTRLIVIESHTAVVCVVTEDMLKDEEETERKGKPFGGRNPVERVRRRKKSLFEPLMAKVNEKRKEGRKSKNVMGFDMTEERGGQ